MQITVEFIGFPAIVSAIGQKKLAMETGGTVSDLFDALVEQYGEKVKDSFYGATGALDSNIQVVLNGNEFLSADKHDRQLQEGDEVLFMLAMAGG